MPLNKCYTTQGININLRRQIRNHRIIYDRIVIRLGGSEKARQYLNKCLYYVHIGNNDYIYNYFLPQFYLTSRFFNTEEYAQNLIDSYSRYIQVLTVSYLLFIFVLQIQVAYIIINFTYWISY